MKKSRCIKRQICQTKRGKAPALMMILILTISTLIAVVTPMQAGKMDPFVSPFTSNNACGCHYNEYISIDNFSMPAQLLVGEKGKVYVNVSLTSTVYNPAKPHYWIATITVTVTSTKGYTTVQGSPKQNVSELPGFTQEYVFNVTGKGAGQDTIKIQAKEANEQHQGCQATDTAQGNILIIKPKEAPVLMAGKVSPSVGFNQTDFTYKVTYMDTDNDLPVSIGVIIDGKAPRAMTVTDGNANTILTGEDYSVKVNGSLLGLGNHTFRFQAADPLFNATGDNITHQGPRVDIYVAPNRPPVPVITSPKAGSTIEGWVNLTGTATDPDKNDVVTEVEVNFDNGSWVVANGTSSWHSRWDLSNMTSGNHAFFARATDGKNYSKSVVVYVHVNKLVREPPSVVITSYHYIAENILEVKGTTARGNNSGPVDLVHLWTDTLGTWTVAQRKGPPMANGTPSYDSWSWTWNTTTVDLGNYTLSARAWTGLLVSTVVNAEVTVIKFNHRPMIISTDPVSPYTKYEGATVTFTVVAGDPDKDPLTYTWSVDKVPKMPIPDPTVLTYKASYTSAGDHEVTVLISDGHVENGTVSYTWKLTILDGFIVTDKTQLATGPINASQAQPFEVSVLDPEGGKISYTWTVDGQKDPAGVGPDYKFLYEPTTAQTTHHNIALKVLNSQGQSKDIKWSVDVKGIEKINTGSTGGKTKNNGGLDAQLIPWLAILLVISAIVFSIYVMARKRKEPEATSQAIAPQPEVQPVLAPQAPAPDPNAWQGYPPTDQQNYQDPSTGYDPAQPPQTQEQNYQYPPTGYDPASQPSTDQPPQLPGQGV